MTQSLDSLLEVAGDFDGIVLDQWGVLHDGTAPYPDAIGAVERLKETGLALAVLSNSGKRADVNRARIAQKGFAPALFDLVMTSGEALWQDLHDKADSRAFYAVTAAPDDARDWAKGLDVMLVDDITGADAVLLMGLPDDADIDLVQQSLLDGPGLPLYCTNPDRASPRAGGRIVTSPGALAHAYAAAGGDVTFYGKPHAAVFAATARTLGIAPERLLMVGDSLEHDVAGGSTAGWATAFVEGGLHAQRFVDRDGLAALRALAEEENAPMPDYCIRRLS